MLLNKHLCGVKSKTLAANTILFNGGTEPSNQATLRSFLKLIFKWFLLNLNFHT